MPTTTSSGSSAAITASSFAKPASVAARSTVVTGRATVPVGSETATPVRAEPKSSASTFNSTERATSCVAAGGERVAHRVDVLAAGLGERRPAAAAAADDRAELADDRDGVDARRATCRGSRRARPCRRRPMRARPRAPPRAARSWSERSRSALPRAPVDLGDEHVALLVLPDDLGASRPRAFGFFASRRACSSSARTASSSRERPSSIVHASPAVTASIRRAPEPTEPSLRITNGPISAVERTCVPPHSSVEKPSISTTRTSSPYFSPKSIIAPSLRASSIGVTNVRTGIASKTFSLTIRSTRARSSGVSCCSCVKSKRSLSGRTAEPACFTWSPSTSRSAWCSRCVAVWFACVGKRSLQLTTASTRVSGASGACPASSTTSTWSSPNLSTSTTSSRVLLAVDGEVAVVG